MRAKYINIIKYSIAAIAILNLILMFGFNYRVPGLHLFRSSGAEQSAAAATTAVAAATAAPAEEVVEPEPEPEVRKCRVTANSLRVRSGPGSDHDVIGSVTRGMELEVVGEEDGWVHVRLEDGSDGFVSAEYVEMLE